MTVDPAIRLEGITKKFRRIHALKGITLEIPTGQVFGFLGPNGAGKTTAIRIMLDLVRPTAGNVYLFGQHVRREHNVLRRVGAIAEGPAFYPYLSAWRNLEVIARTANRYDPAQIKALLDRVGLANRAHQRVRTYSLGMKQRLGVAAALITNPDILILDEPTNGLDPAGMQEIRQLIREESTQRGRTVFLSSHLLNEVEQVCDRVAIIHRGEVLREGAVSALLSSGTRLYLEGTPHDTLVAALSERWQVAPEGNGVTLAAAPEDAPAIVRTLVERAVDVYQVVVHRQSLEEFFLDVTGTGKGIKTNV